MSVEAVVVILLGFAAAVAGWRVLRRLVRGEMDRRPRGWRVAAIVLAQAASALLLYLTLFPPPGTVQTSGLTVLTANADFKQAATANIGGRKLALPEAPASMGTERFPDLATALRRYPHTARLRVIGAGLTPRDQDAARGIAVEFDPAPVPRGLVELRSPRRVVSGARWRLAGRVERVTHGSVQLRDPAGSVAARAMLADDGSFVLAQNARTAGRAVYRLRVLDADQRAVEDVAIPLLTVAGAPLRVLLLSGAPNPELKYLRRWAADAGVQLRSRINLSTGVHMTDSGFSVNAATLSEFDLVILDERGWRSLGADGANALIQALRAGLGVLLRLTGPLSDADRSGLRTLGFEVESADIVQAVRLPRGGDLAVRSVGRQTSTSTASAMQTAPTLSRRPLRVGARQGSALLRSDTGEPLALWRAEGRGRIALWWLSDSYRLVLDGDAPAHGSIWSHAAGLLARPRGGAGPEWRDDDTHVHQRQTLCGITADASVVAPSGTVVRLSPDPAAGGSACAGYWPAEPGWHVLASGGGEWPFYVRAATDAAGLAANAAREHTQRIAASANDMRRSVPLQDTGSRWPWFLAWLLATAGVWWLERARVGWLRQASAATGD